MKKSLLCGFMILLISTAFAQRHDFNFRPASTGHTGTGDNIDVKYHRFEWNVNPDISKRIWGNVTTYFLTTENNVSKLSFDLYRPSFDNANLIVKYHGNTVPHSFPSSGNRDILNIDLQASLPIGTLDSVTIFYDGIPPTSGSHPGGCKLSTISGVPLFFTISESYEDKEWWPCKADMQDKIDSLTFIVTVPKAYTAIVNGMKISEVISGANKTCVYKHKYPIASYLVSIAVSKYNYYDAGTVNIGGVNMPVEYYISSGHTNNTTALNVMNQCKQELVVFSNLFGDYPYKNEKYGMYEFGYGGGMEHQTMSGMGYNAMKAWDVVAHELMHQWFGDKVTMATWNHLWLSEGFASYGEILAAELIPSIGANPSSVRSSLKSQANSTSQSTYSAYIPDANIQNSNTIWYSQYGNTVYSRGGMVLSMLRTLMGDSNYFRACRNYLNDPALAYGTATTADLEAHMEAEIGGFDLSGFFNSFVYGNGYPSYSGSNSIQWDPIGGGKIRFRVKPPTKSTGSNVGTYYSVIPLRVQGAGGEDTLIVLYDQGSTGVSVGGNGITFGNSPTPEVYLGFDPISVSFDPYNMSLAMGTVMQTTVLATNIADFSVQQKNGRNVSDLTIADYDAVRNVTLEHSFDGTNFTASGSMFNKGNGSYTYSENSFSNLTFYRAKVELQTGEIIYSSIVKLAGNNNDLKISLINNPVKDELKIRIPGNLINGSWNYSIMDMSGKVLQKGIAPQGGGLLQISIHSAVKGTHLLHLQSGTLQKTIQFIIE